MGDRHRPVPAASVWLAASVSILALLACARADIPLPLGGGALAAGDQAPPPADPSPLPEVQPAAIKSSAVPTPVVVLGTPTPDPTRQPPPQRTEPVAHVVQFGESLGRIAYQYGVSLDALMQANGLFNPDFLPVGRVLTIPVPEYRPPGPSLKLLPDSELAYGPSSAVFNVEAEVARWNGALSMYREDVEGTELTGAQIVQLVAQRYSVNPRLLLAALEYQAGWMTNPNLGPEWYLYPLGFVGENWQGMFGQLSWAADQLNAGYYSWLAGWSGPYVLADGSNVPPGSGINAGTAGIQYMFSRLYGVDAWQEAIEAQGFISVYQSLFGDPFSQAIEPLFPEGLQQPQLQLPFEPGKAWSFTSGPHSAWGEGSAWAALDFAPPGYALGCVFSNEWVVAAADGIIVRADQGEVIQDLDRDGLEQTGWALLYLHVESRDRVATGAFVRAGDLLGHPSCEGGVSSGTHLHLARKYNGVWMSADGPLPFNLEGWISSGEGQQYDGYLTKGARRLEACGCRQWSNQISR